MPVQRKLSEQGKKELVMIPKTIHYCWFGGKPLPDPAQKCIASWKKYCPDFEIKEWNESNYDISSVVYTKEAYAAKKWAFVTDYVRLDVISKYGGIYMDTDVEVIKSLDGFLGHGAFSGFENGRDIPTGIMGGIPRHQWYKYLLDYYTGRHFIMPDGAYDMTTNVEAITDITKAKYRINLNNTYQELEDGLVFYPAEYFCPKISGKLIVTNNTCTIHHFAGSWTPAPVRFYVKVRDSGIKLFGYGAGKLLTAPVFVITKLLTGGISGLVKAFKTKTAGFRNKAQ
jgi:hypothetical protein